ncbi:MAG TPA: copper-binding protein [Thermoanaerobaculia bacterium]|jgi:Cu/Ag efflux protein CusF|nr:copper-binding protein [Thermoanaerobaculia bacterium]
MKKALTVSLFVFLCAAAAAYAHGRKPHEGKITNIDMDQKTITVEGEHGQTWTINWTDTTKVKGAKLSDLKVGDSIHFDVTEKDGKMWATEIRRTHTAKM